MVYQLSSSDIATQPGRKTCTLTGRFRGFPFHAKQIKKSVKHNAIHLTFLSLSTLIALTQ
jgi:hypothetical protein